MEYCQLVLSMSTLLYCEEPGAEVCVVDATARGLSLEDPSGIAAPTFAPNRI
jgi:hypothetical protein